MAKKLKRKRVRPAPLPQRRAGEVPTPAFHQLMIVKKHCEDHILKHREAAVRQVDERRRLVDFIASTQEVDRDQEVVITRGIDLAAFRLNPIFLLDHDRRAPLGRVVALGVERLGNHDALTGTAEILAPGASQRVDEAWGEIKAGARNGISIGFLPIDVDPPGTRGRVLRRVELLEISSVTMPSCRACVVTGASGAKALADQAALAASIQETLRRGAELLAKLDVQIPYRYIDMTGFTLLDPRRHLARDVSFHAAKELGIPPPALKFFTSTDPERAEFVSEKMWGYSRKGDHIAIEWTLSPAEMTQVVAHEVAHAAGLDEEKADAFGKQFAARYAKMLPAPRPGGHWSYEQAAAAAMWVRLQGVRM